MNQRLRVGLIGLGRVAMALEEDPLREKPCTHLGAWLACPEVEIVAGADLNVTTNNTLKAKIPGSRLYTDYQAMLKDNALDMVSVCGYATERAEMIEAACAMGVKGIWAEKALACSMKEITWIEQALSTHRTALIVNHLRRWMPHYQYARDLIQDGVLGQLESVNVHFSGNMLHTGTHAFDLIRLLAGEVDSVQAWLKAEAGQNMQSGYRESDSYGSDYGGFALMHLANGAVATVHGHDKNYFRFEFEILGSRGMMRIGNTQRELWLADASTRFQQFTELAQREFGPVEDSNPWISAARDLINAVRTGGEVRSSVHDGKKAFEIGLATHISHFEGNRPVSLINEALPDYYAFSR